MIAITKFPFKDLKRRKRQTTSSVLALSLIAAGATFVIIASENFDSNIRTTLEGKLNVGFIDVFFDFTNLMIILSVLTGAIITYFLASINMAERRKDIGIMKSVGCLTHIVFGNFATELFVIVFSSSIIGTGLGVGLCFFSIGLSDSSFFESPMFVSPWLLMVFLLVFIIVSIFFGIQPIIKAIRMMSAEALVPRVSREAYRPNVFLSKMSFSFKIAFRSLLRKGYDLALIIVCFFLVMVLTTMMVAGATIVNDTTQNYIERAIGQNVILVSHADISAYYTDLLLLFSQTNGKNVDFLDPKYRISEVAISELNKIPGVVKADPRFIFEALVHEVQGVAYIVEGKRAVFLGDHRSCAAIIHGVEPDQMVNEWFMWEKSIDESNLPSVVLGDTLCSEIISYPVEQKIEIHATRFEISGVALDPFNTGLVVYAPLNSISPLINHTEYNLLFLKANSAQYSEVLETIKTELSDSNMEYIELNKVIEKYADFFNFFWSPYILLSLFFLGASIVCLFGYTLLYISEQEVDFTIMKALGTKPRMILKIILIENIAITILGGVPGIFTGFLVIFYFLMPSPVISHVNLLSVGGWLIFGLGLFCISGLYSASRVARIT